MTPAVGTPRRRIQGDRGAAVAEAAIITPVVLFLLFGIFEIGLLYRNYLTVGDGIADATRMGGIWGPDLREMDEGATVSGDYVVMAALREGLGAIPLDSIERVVIFKASGPGLTALAQVPSSCKISSVSIPGRCNIYDPEEAFYRVQLGHSWFFNCSTNPDACGWDPTTRNDGPAVNQIDYLGVYVKVNHQFVSGIFGSDIALDQAAIARLEPGGTG